MDPMAEIADILERLAKPAPIEIRRQLEHRIKELEAEYLEQEIEVREWPAV